MKKYTILTLPLISNYGGILQAFSLSHATKNMGKQVTVFDYSPKNIRRSLKEELFYLFKTITKITLLYTGSNKSFTVPSILSRRNCRSFIKKYIPITSDLIKTSAINNAFIVGSDQVWRKFYADWCANLSFFFLKDSDHDVRNNSFSYAASFGSDEWEGEQEETNDCKRLLQGFKAVSVREHSGVKICKEIFGVDAVQMPDPTLLLHEKDYNEIINKENTWKPDGKYLAAYILDKDDGNLVSIQNCAKQVRLQLQHLIPQTNAKKRRDRFPIRVPQWLRLIRDCEYFITDSFHGCVFAIIFNKSFVCLGNEKRGSARFDTLLGTFGLESRLITDATPEKIQQVLQTPIDWEKVNAIHDTERERGINFLKENLSE